MYTNIWTDRDRISKEDKLIDWSNKWKMPFDTNECEMIVFGDHAQPLNYPEIYYKGLMKSST